MKIVDSHCHLDDEKFDGDLDEIIDLFEENNLDFVVDPASDLNSSKKIIEIIENSPSVYGAVGIHPMKLRM